MNYFGLFFSFMIPGIIVGAMLATVFSNAVRKRASSSKRRASN